MNNDVYELAFIAECDFRRSEATNLVEAQSLFRGIEPGEVFLFISHSKNQLIFILGNYNGVIDSRRWRLLDGQWDMTDVVSYAANVGITIGNVDELDDFFREND